MLKGRTPLVIALVLALLAGILAWQTIEHKESKVQEGWNLTPVIVATRTIAEGTALDYDMIAKSQLPEKFVSPSVIKPDAFERVIGQRLLVPLQAGDIITWSQFRQEGTFERLSNIVTKRTRAITLSSGGPAGVGGWIRPNDHVDILGTFQDPKSNQQVTVTLMQDIIVLATGKLSATTNAAALSPKEREYNSITVMVLPEEAEIMVLASQFGQIYLTLRNPEDIGGQEERGRATIETLLTGERVKALEKTRNSVIKVIRGGG